MNRAQRIISVLNAQLHPAHIDLRDESHLHAGHAGARPGGETHYALAVTAECFKGQSKIRRHQAIYRLLADEFANGLHALSIQAHAPGEE